MSDDQIRDRTVAIKLNDQEVELLDQLAGMHRSNRSDLIRGLIALKAIQDGLEIPDRMKYETT